MFYINYLQDDLNKIAYYDQPGYIDPNYILTSFQKRINLQLYSYQ